MKKSIYLLSNFGNYEKLEYENLYELKDKFSERNITIGNFATIGDLATIGDFAAIGNSAKIGDFATIGKSATIGNLAKIGDLAAIGNSAKIGDFATIGTSATIGDFATIGTSAKIGDFATIGKSATIVEQYVIYNSYEYTASAYHNLTDGKNYIQLGCHLRSVEDWENDFWNNDREFPNDCSEKSEKRFKTYKKLKTFLEL